MLKVFKLIWLLRSCYKALMLLLILICSTVIVIQMLIKIHGIYRGRTAKSEYIDNRTSYSSNTLSFEEIRNRFILEPSKLEYNLSRPDYIDHSGAGQASIVDTILKHKRNGFFVECGALDGERSSNTLYLERYRNWTGLLVEADPSNYNMLVQKHRKAYVVKGCLSIYNYSSKVLFNTNKNMGRIYQNTLLLKVWTMKNGLKFNLRETQCFPLDALMAAVNRTKIDYLSLDVEGSELDILKTINFHKLDITIISVEYCHVTQGKSRLRKFLEGEGYQLTRDLNKGANDYIFLLKRLVSRYGKKN